MLSRTKSNMLTHFEIYGGDPANLADFYRTTLGWDIEQMPAIDYWRINTGSARGPGTHWRANIPYDPPA